MALPDTARRGCFRLPSAETKAVLGENRFCHSRDTPRIGDTGRLLKSSKPLPRCFFAGFLGRTEDAAQAGRVDTPPATWLLNRGDTNRKVRRFLSGSPLATLFITTLHRQDIT